MRPAFENWCWGFGGVSGKSPGGWITPAASIVAVKPTAAKGAQAAKA